jgi:hypothetical protein
VSTPAVEGPQLEPTGVDDCPDCENWRAIRTAYRAIGDRGAVVAANTAFAEHIKIKHRGAQYQ